MAKGHPRRPATGGGTPAPPTDDLVGYISGDQFSPTGLAITASWSIENSSFWGGTSPMELRSAGTSAAPRSALPSVFGIGTDAYGNDEAVVAIQRTFSQRIECDLPTFGGETGTIQFWYRPLSSGFSASPFEMVSQVGQGCGINPTMTTANQFNATAMEKWQADLGQAFTTNTASLPNGTWGFISFEWDWPNQDVAVYLGTTAGGSATGQLLSHALAAKNMAICGIVFGNNRLGSSGLNGYFCDIRFYNRAIGGFAATRSIPSARLA